MVRDQREQNVFPIHDLEEKRGSQRDLKKIQRGERGRISRENMRVTSKIVREKFE